MGSVAKPLIRLQGVPLISRKLVALSGAGVDEVVVTGYVFALLAVRISSVDKAIAVVIASVVTLLAAFLRTTRIATGITCSVATRGAGSIAAVFHPEYCDDAVAGQFNIRYHEGNAEVTVGRVSMRWIG